MDCLSSQVLEGRVFLYLASEHIDEYDNTILITSTSLC